MGECSEVGEFDPLIYIHTTNALGVATGWWRGGDTQCFLMLLASFFFCIAEFIEERARGLQFFINNLLDHSEISER